MSELTKYLDYYETRTNPGYAVMVTGAWGVGKTFQVKEALKSRRPHYVSLFGLQGPAEIYQAVFTAMFPEAASIKKAADQNKDLLVGGVPLGKIASQLLNSVIRERADNSRTIIFDDLERSRIPAEDLLGVINRYVEHHQCRVIVIAHEGKLSDELLSQREKLIGQTVQVSPDTRSAVDSFIGEFSDHETAEFFARFGDEIVGLFHQSEVQSLRILRHAIEDLARLVRTLLPEHRKKEEALRELALLFTALAFETRARRLTRQDIRNRQGAELSFHMRRHGDKNIEVPAIVTAMQRYPLVQLDSQIVSDEVVECTLFDGVYDAERIRQSVSSSVHFATPEQLPAWKVFIEFQHRSDQDAEQAMDRLIVDFQSRNISTPGEMLHLFALRLMMAANELISRSVDETVRDCERYIDDLVAQKRLKPLMATYLDREDLGHGFGGYGYWVQKDTEDAFKVIFKYLYEARQRSLEETLPSAGAEILAALRENSDKFADLLIYRNDKQPKFAQMPVLAHVDPEDFVTAWMNLHPESWQLVGLVLSERFRQPDLTSEHSWGRKVSELLNVEAARVGGIRGLRIRLLSSRLPLLGS